MASKKTSIFIPKGAAGDDTNMFVSVNGKGYLLPRGKYSDVPPEVAAEIERSERAQARYDEFAAAQQKRSKAPINQPTA